MGDRGVLMEELLMAQETTLVSERTAARASQREAAALKQLETLQLSIEAQRACEQSVEEQNQILALRVDALTTELQESQQTALQQRERIQELEGRLASPQSHAAWQLVTEEGKGLHVRLCKAELERDNLLLRLKRMRAAEVRSEAEDTRHAEALEFEEHFKNLLGSYAEVAEGLRKERSQMQARLTEQQQRLADSERCRKSLEARISDQEEAQTQLQDSFESLKQLATAAIPDAKDHAESLQGLQLAYQFTREELTQCRDEASAAVEATTKKLAQVEADLAQATAEVGRCHSTLEKAETHGRGLVLDLEARLMQVEAELQASRDGAQNQGALEAQLVTVKEQCDTERARHSAEKQVLWQEMGRIEDGVRRVREESNARRQILQSLHQEFVRGNPIEAQCGASTGLTDAAMGADLKKIWHVLVLRFHDTQQELEQLTAGLSEMRRGADERHSTLSETEVLLDDARRELSQALQRLALCEAEVVQARSDREEAIEGANAALMVHQEQVAGMEQEATELRRLVTGGTEEVKELQRSLREQEILIERLQTAAQESDETVAEMVAVKNEAARLREELESATRGRIRLKDELDALVKNKASLREQLRQAEEAEEQAKDEIAALRIATSQATRELEAEARARCKAETALEGLREAYDEVCTAREAERGLDGANGAGQPEGEGETTRPQPEAPPPLPDLTQRADLAVPAWHPSEGLKGLLKSEQLSVGTIFELKVTPPREGLANWKEAPKATVASSLLPSPRSPPSVLFGPGGSKLAAHVNSSTAAREVSGFADLDSVQRGQRSFILEHRGTAAEVA